MSIALRATMLTACAVSLVVAAGSAAAQTWTADNGNGTYSNPLFYDELSDPDLIRVGDDYYMTGTTMHSMPGLPLLHSKDLVNWTLASYAFDRLDLGPQSRLQEGRHIYGQGIWAPSLRHHDGTFYIFANINRHRTQLFRARDPRGPWTRSELKGSYHDPSVLFDDDGKVYIIWGYRTIRLAQLDTTFTDIVPGSERIIIEEPAGMGEGVHFYKIDGKYLIISAWWSGEMRMPAARADHVLGPYEVIRAISVDEDFGVMRGYRLRSDSTVPFQITPPDPRSRGQISLHQGGIVQTPEGEWWGVSMMDYNSVGRLTALSPVTWHEGWPYFGLAGNLGRTPRIWVKPRTRTTALPSAPYQRSDDFRGPALANVWQWNHLPDDTRWSLRERPGFLRLHALPATELWWARNTLTQRAVGPRSTPTAVLETSGLRVGDVAGLALFNRPYAWIGVRRDSDGWHIEQFDQTTGRSTRRALAARRVWLRADCDFLTEKARFSFSTDGRRFQPLGDEFTMVFQLKTFQGVRYALFNYNTEGVAGGYADFDGMMVHEPHPRGLTRIPVGKTIALASAVGDARFTVAGATTFKVIDRQRGRIALQTTAGFVTVKADGSVALHEAEPADAETFQWIETPYGDVALLSLATHRYLSVQPSTRQIRADHPGPSPDRADGVHLRWHALNDTRQR